MNEIYKSGDTLAGVELWRNAAKEFPNDNEVMMYLITALTNAAWGFDADDKANEERNELLKEAVEIGEALSAKATNQHIMYMAIDRLSSAYKELGEIEKAVKIANKLPTAWVSKEAQLMRVLEGAELKTHSQDFLLRLIGSIGNVIHSLRCCDYDNEQTIQIYGKAIQLIKLFFEDGDYGVRHFDLSNWYSEIAKNYAEMNDADAVIENLSAAAEHAIAYDLLEENVSHTSLLFNMRKTKRYGKTYMSNESQNALKRMSVEHYDFCRDDERFTEIKNRLTAVGFEDINT